jgi:hypothetical protein
MAEQKLHQWRGTAADRRAASRSEREGGPVNYLDRIAVEIRRTAHPDAVARDDLPLYRLYAVLLLAKGQAVTVADVHNAWAAWASEHEPASPHLMPFAELSGHIQQKDEPYVEAIRTVAARLNGR